MEKDLRSGFEELDICTMECINSLQNNDYDTFDKLIMKRKDILDLIESYNCTREEYNNLVYELNILSHQKILSDLIHEKRIELRNKIDIIEKNKIATSSYNKGLMKSAIIFSKKI